MKLGITGHQRLPAEDSWVWVRHEIKAVLMLNGKAGLSAYSSLAIGADQEFAMLAVDSGARLRVIVPCSGYEDTFKTTADLSRYRFLLSKASSVDSLGYTHPCEDAFMEAGKIIADTVDQLIAVWDGERAAGFGGTGDAVAYALNRGTRVIHIDPVTRTVTLLPPCKKG